MSATGPSLRLAAMALRCATSPAIFEAVRVFERSPLATAHLGAEMVRIFSAAKRQEHERLTGIVPAAEHGAHLRTV